MCLAAFACKITIAVHPTWIEMHILLGRLFTRLGRLQDAVCCWKNVVKTQPALEEAHVKLAEAFIQLGCFDEAFSCWKRAFSVKPNGLELSQKIATSFYLRGRMSESRSIIQYIIDAQNNFAKTHELDQLGLRFLREFPISIGHIALLDYYVKMDIFGQRSQDSPILLIASEAANPSYLDYWRRYLPQIITDPVAVELLSPVSQYLEDYLFAVKDSVGNQVFEFYSQVTATEERWESEGRGPLLALKNKDYNRGWDCLQKLGIPPDAWFVCLHVREEAPRSRAALSADITTYRMAIESIVTRGGWVIRQGDPSMTPLPSMPQVIDYVHTNVRSDWMDVFLWAKCRFFIGTQSGPWLVPPTFGVPCVLTNWSS